MKFNGLIKEPVINTDTADEPVNVEELKNYLRISNDSEDDIVELMGKAARKKLEGYTGRYFKLVNITVTLKNEMGDLTLPYYPNGDVVYKDMEDAVIDDFDLTDERCDPFTATYDTGYETLPDDLKLAIMAQVAFSYQNRGDDNKAGGLSEYAKVLASNYRVVWI